MTFDEIMKQALSETMQSLSFIQTTLLRIVKATFWAIRTWQRSLLSSFFKSRAFCGFGVHTTVRNGQRL